MLGAARKGVRLPRPRTRSLLALAAAALSSAACAPPREPLVIGLVPEAGNGLALVALDRGFFAHEGIALEVRSFASGRDALRALLAREVDVATVYQTPVVLAALEGPSPVRLLTVVHRASRNTALVARADRGIATVGDQASPRSSPRCSIASAPSWSGPRRRSSSPSRPASPGGGIPIGSTRW